MKNRPIPLFKGEGTLDDAIKENQKRIRSLQKIGNKKATALADKLDNCCSAARCRSPACYECNWFTCRCHVRKIRRIFKAYSAGYFVTIVPIGGFFKPRALRQINIRLLKDTLRKRMERAGLSEAIIVGGIEATYKFDKKKICLHWHLIFGNCSKNDINKLRNSYLKDRQMRVDEIKPEEKSRVYSYCLKNVTFGKDPFTKKPKRPTPNVEAKLLYFLDRHTFRELMFLKGARFNGDKLGVIDKSAIRRKTKGKEKQA